MNLDLDRANHITTPCTVEKKELDNARSDENKGENRAEPGQTEAQHDWDAESDRRTVQMTSDGKDDSQALAGGDITKYSAGGSRQLSVTRSTRSQVRVTAGVLRDGQQCVIRNESRGLQDTSLAGRRRNAGSAGNRVATWKRNQTQTVEGTRPFDYQCQLERL